MGVIEEDKKRVAKDERDHWKRFEIDAGFAGATLSAAAGGAAVLAGITAAIAAGPIIAVAAAVWWAQRKLVSVERFIDDPPRPDFREPVLLVEYPVFAEGFNVEDPVQSASLAFSRALAHNISFVDAIVLASERVDGALLAGDRATADARAREADQLIGNLPGTADTVAEEGRRLASALRASRLRALDAPYLSSQPVPERLIDVMPESTQAAVFRAGMNVGPFLVPFAYDIFRNDPLGAMAESLEVAVESTVRFARTVAERRPEPPLLA